MKQKDFRHFLSCESAVSEIIGAIMLLAIAVAMIALIQTESVPEWNKAIEMDHYNVVYDDFLKIRSDIEDVALFQFPKSSVIHMGAHYPDRLIFRNPAGTSGTITSDHEWINVSYINSTGNYTNNNFSSTSIRFEPNYNYYSNAASLVYEHGLIIKDFTDDNYIYTDTVQSIFSTNAVNIVELDFSEDSESFSGTKALNYFPQPINSTYNNTNVTVTFDTNYPQLWSTLLTREHLNYNRYRNTINVVYTGSTTINIYIVNGSLVSGIGVSATPTEYTYVSSIFDLLNITGNVTNFPAAQDASDGDASAAFDENINVAITDSYNYTYVTSNADTSGTTTSFSSMTSNSSDYATLSEGSVISSNITISPVKSIVNGTQSGSYNATKLDNNDNSIDVITRKSFDRGNITSWSFSSNPSWTNTCTGSGGTCTMSWIDSGYLESDLSGSNDERTATWQSNGFTWNNGTPDSARLDFDWRLKYWLNGASGNTYSVKLVKPDASEVYLYPTTTFTEPDSDTWYSISNSSISPSDFSQSGTYKIKLISLLRTSSVESQSEEVKFQWDNPKITLTKTRYSTDATYSFTQTKPNSSWINITISDSSYAPNGTNVFIYNKTSSAWESIRTSNFTNGTNDSSHVSNKVILNPSNYDTGSGVIKIKYEGIELGSNSDIGIDLLQPVFYYTIFQMNISTTISSIPADSAYILETRYQRGNTNETGYNLSIWNYTSSAWENPQSLTATSWTQNNLTLISDQISGGQVKTRFTDQTPTGTSRGNLSIDYQRIHGTTAGTPYTYHLNITTITTDIPDAGNHTLQLRYYVSGDSFTLKVWNGSNWNNKTTLNEFSLSYRNITLLSDELILDSTAGGSNKYYALVRYVDMDTNPTQQGTIYLDYQRIYNI